VKKEYKRNEKLVATQKVNQNTDICQREHIARQSHFTVSHIHHLLNHTNPHFNVIIYFCTQFLLRW